MIKKIVNKVSLTDSSSAKKDLAYWLNKTPKKATGRKKDLADMEALGEE